jgi:hypothetical protein
MSAEHYVRPDDEEGSESRQPSGGGWRRFTRRFTNFMFKKQPDRNPPGIFPNKGFNSNGRRHS